MNTNNQNNNRLKTKTLIPNVQVRTQDRARIHLLESFKEKGIDFIGCDDENIRECASMKANMILKNYRHGDLDQAIRNYQDLLNLGDIENARHLNDRLNPQIFVKLGYYRHQSDPIGKQVIDIPHSWREWPLKYAPHDEVYPSSVVLAREKLQHSLDLKKGIVLYPDKQSMPPVESESQESARFAFENTVKASKILAVGLGVLGVVLISAVALASTVAISDPIYLAPSNAKYNQERDTIMYYIFARHP